MKRRRAMTSCCYYRRAIGLCAILACCLGISASERLPTTWDSVSPLSSYRQRYLKSSKKGSSKKSSKGKGGPPPPPPPPSKGKGVPSKGKGIPEFPHNVFYKRHHPLPTPSPTAECDGKSDWTWEWEYYYYWEDESDDWGWDYGHSSKKKSSKKDSKKKSPKKSKKIKMIHRKPTCAPTSSPTQPPGQVPTQRPSRAPVVSPTLTPGQTFSPTVSVTNSPTLKGMTRFPTVSPTTSSPTVTPSPTTTTRFPTVKPTGPQQSRSPTIPPSKGPSSRPTTAMPSMPVAPSTDIPSGGPTAVPRTDIPTIAPTPAPTSRPSTGRPSRPPTETPTGSPVITASPTRQLEVMLTPFNLQYNVDPGLPPPSNQDFQQAADITGLYIMAFMTEFFRNSGETVLESVQVLPGSFVGNPVQIQYSVIATFSDASTRIPSQAELNDIMSSAFVPPAVGLLLFGLQNNLPASNPISTTSSVEYMEQVSAVSSQSKVSPAGKTAISSIVLLLTSIGGFYLIKRHKDKKMAWRYNPPNVADKVVGITIGDETMSSQCTSSVASPSVIFSPSSLGRIEEEHVEMDRIDEEQEITFTDEKEARRLLRGYGGLGLPNVLGSCKNSEEDDDTYIEGEGSSLVSCSDIDEYTELISQTIRESKHWDNDDDLESLGSGSLTVSNRSVFTDLIDQAIEKSRAIRKDRAEKRRREMASLSKGGEGSSPTSRSESSRQTQASNTSVKLTSDSDNVHENLRTDDTAS